MLATKPWRCVFQDGKFSVLQAEGAAGWCVNPQNGQQIRIATLRPGGQLTCTHTHTLCLLLPFLLFTATLNTVVCLGPSRCQLLASQCRPDGSFLPLQCDITSCWCVSEEGQEVSGTRSLRQTGQTPSCERKCEQELLAVRTDLRVLMLTVALPSLSSPLPHPHHPPWFTGVSANNQHSSKL